MLTFRVDDVVPAADLLPTVSLTEVFPDALVIGGDPAQRVLVPNGVHPLLAAVGRAFADHRPLVLTPDAVWLTIAQGLAQHIRLHAKELRFRLVDHTGNKDLVVSVNGTMPRDADSWRDVTEELGKLLATHARGTDLFECDFSTSTEVDQVASRVIMMDAYSPYFSYWIVGVCGIPEIMLTGTAGDWQKIRARVDRLADLGLQTWCRSLIPIADHFVRAAAGDVDVAFWKRIYNPQDAYGGKVITGWASRFYPYLADDGSQQWPNPMLDLPIDEPRDMTPPDPAHRWGYSGPGIRSSRVPATLSNAIIKVNGRADGANETVALHAGLIGIAQDDDGALRPISGWHLVSAQPQIDDVIDRIIRDHSTTAPGSRRRLQGTPELMALYARIGSASLFDCAWRLLPADEHRNVYRGMNLLSMTPIIELADGRMIAEASNRRGTEIYWVVGRFAPQVHEGPIQLMNADLLDDPADVPVYGSSLAMLLEVALETGGDISNLETSRLSQVEGGAP